jgi:hypothetical protein
MSGILVLYGTAILDIRAQGFIDNFLIEGVNFVSVLFGSPAYLILHSMVSWVNYGNDKIRTKPIARIR